MNPTPAFQQQQRQFLNYLRQPQAALLPNGFAPERLAVYVDLLYNKFDESLTACFPVIHSLLNQDNWRALLLDFIARHRCQTPYYRQIPDEFVQYLQQERQHPDDWPFLAELAHFEWIELQLSIAEAEAMAVKPLSAAQLLAGVPVFAPVIELLHYRWPVQDIGPSYQPREAPTTVTHILGFRDSRDQVQFIALNSATNKLIKWLRQGLSGEQALQVLANEFTDVPVPDFIHYGQQILADLNQRGAIIDVRPADTLEHHL